MRDFSKSPILRPQVLWQLRSLHQWGILEFYISAEPLSPGLARVDNRIRQNHFMFFQIVLCLLRFSPIVQFFQEQFIVDIPILIFPANFMIFLRGFEFPVLEARQQKVADLIESLQECILKGFKSRLVDIVGGSSLLNQELHHFQMVPSDGSDEGSVTFFGGLVWISFILCNEELCKFGIVVVGRLHECGDFRSRGDGVSDQRGLFGENLLNLGQIAPVDVVVKVFVV